MSSEVDREAFMRMMGLTAADVADPDSVPKRTSSRTDAPQSSAATEGMANRNAACFKVSSPAASSAAGLSNSTSLRGDSDLVFNSYTSTKTSLNNGDAGVKLSSTFTSSAERSTAPLKQSARTVSFVTQPHRTTAAAATTPRPTSMIETLKEEGNRAFESGLFVEAVRHYSAAIEALTQSGVGGDSGGAAAANMQGAFGATPGSTPRCGELELLAALHSNRSAAYLQAARQWGDTEEAYGRALCDADRAVALRPLWFKGYTRQGDACFKLRRYGAAAEAYEMALQLDPRNTTLADALAESRLRAKQAAREELELRRTTRATGGSHMSSMKATERDVDEKRWMDSDGIAHRTTTTSAPLAGESAHRTGDGRRSSGQAPQLWEDLKHEVEVAIHAPTGDAYRLQQLERFRKRDDAATVEGRHNEANAQKCAAARSGQRNRLRPEPASAHADDHQPTATHAQPPTEKVSTSTDCPRGDRPTGLFPTTPAPAATATPTGSAAAGPTTSASSPMSIPHRSTYDAPTAGGIPAAMANFRRPVTSARDVPYEFSSAAASAYQQQLLEAFRQRKARQP